MTLARTIRRYRNLIWNTLDHGPSNAKSEATNTHLRALTRAYGNSPDALIAMAMLTEAVSAQHYQDEMTHYNVSRSSIFLILSNHKS